MRLLLVVERHRKQVTDADRPGGRRHHEVSQVRTHCRVHRQDRQDGRYRRDDLLERRHRRNGHRERRRCRRRQDRVDRLHQDDGRLLQGSRSASTDRGADERQVDRAPGLLCRLRQTVHVVLARQFRSERPRKSVGGNHIHGERSAGRVGRRFQRRHPVRRDDRPRLPASRCQLQPEGRHRSCQFRRIGTRGSFRRRHLVRGPRPVSAELAPDGSHRHAGEPAPGHPVRSAQEPS